MDDVASPSAVDVAGGDATLMTNVQSTSALNKTGSGNFYIGSSSSLSVGSFEVIAGQTIVSAGGQLIATNGGPTNQSHITVWPGATLTTEGALIVGGTVTNQGTLRLIGNAQMSLGGMLINYGVLDIISWTGALPTNLVNNGSVLNRNSVHVDSWGVVGHDFHLTIMGYTGHSYQLQYASDLHGSSWTNLGAPQAGNQAPLVFVHPNGVTATQGFYRMAVD
jgi:hypothetical protein